MLPTPVGPPPHSILAISISTVDGHWRHASDTQEGKDVHNLIYLFMCQMQ